MVYIYAEFVVPLVKAVQELSSQNSKFKIQNDELVTTKQEQVKTNADLQKQIDELKEAMIKLINLQKCIPTTQK